MRCREPLALLLIILILLQLPPASATAEGDFNAVSRAEAEGLVVTDRIVITDKNWTVSENVIIKSGGELFVNNTRVVVESGEQLIVITVEPGGKLNLANSSFSILDEGDVISEMPFIFGYKLDIQGELQMNNSTVSYTGYDNSIKPSDQSVVGNTNKWSFKGFLITNATAEIFNSTFDNNTGLYATNSTMLVERTTFIDSVGAMYLTTTRLRIEGCDFIDNAMNLDIRDTNHFYISNSTFKSVGIFFGSIAGIICETAFGVIEECTFEFLNTGMGFFGSVITVNNCIFETCLMAIMAYATVLDIKNISIARSISIEAYPYIGFGEILSGIFCEGSHIDIENSSIGGCAVSAMLADSEVLIANSTFENSEGGISISNSDFFSNNLTIINNTIGLEMLNSVTSILNSTISKNLIGIQTQESTLILHENNISGNDEWGIISELSDIRFSGENFPKPAAWPVDSSINGLGNLAEITGFSMDVYDTFDVPLVYMDVKIENECFKDYHMESEFLSFYYYNTTTTDSFGNAEFYWLIEYVMVDGYDKVYCTDYKVTAWYPFSGGNIVENSTMVNLESFPEESVMLKLELPNISTNKTELQLSKSEVKKGETLKVKTKVRYTGPSSVNIPAFDAILYIDGVLIQTLEITSLSPTNPEIELEFSWMAESGVPYPEQIESRQIKVELDIPDDFEYAEDTTRYTADNEVTVWVDIDIEDDSGWSIGSGSKLIWYMFLWAIFILILILVITPFLILKKRKKIKSAEVKGSKKESEAETEAEDAEDSKDASGSGERSTGSEDEAETELEDTEGATGSGERSTGSEDDAETERGLEE